MRIFLIISALLLSITHCLAQDKVLILSGGVIRQKRWTGEFTLMYGAYDNGGPCNGPALGGVGLGAEFVSMQEGKTIIAPKITAQFSGLIFCFRASEINYLHNGFVDVRLLPEIGLSAFGPINLCYGYNFHLFGNKFNDISSHRVSLTFSLPVSVKKGKLTVPLFE